MKNNFKLVFLPLLLLSVLLGMMSCNKDTEDPYESNIEKIIGTWKMKDGNYSGTMTFNSSFLAYDYFTSETKAGVGLFDWIIADDVLTMSLIVGQGDYNEYNEMPNGTGLNALVEITEDELTIEHNGEVFVYTRLAPDKFVELTEIEGTWQSTDVDSRGVITFDVNSDIWDNIGTESFVTATDSGAADFIWNVTGNMIFMSYENQQMFGDFSSHNEVNPNGMRIVELSATDNQLTFFVDGDSYIYTRVSSDHIVSKSDLLGSWKLSDGTLTEIISFDIVNTIESGKFKHSFIDGDYNGEIDNNYWTVSGDIFSLEYQGFPEDDYTDYYGVSSGDHTQLTMGVSYVNDQLTFSNAEGSYTYTRMDSIEIFDQSELIGSWEITIDDYSDTLTFTSDNKARDSFSDGDQSGAAVYSCYYNGNILRMHCGSMTGNYESYYGYSLGENIYSFLSLTDNQLTITNEGVDYVYTKSSD
jgi:hypothetical protein